MMYLVNSYHEYSNIWFDREYVERAINCITESGSQSLCDELLECSSYAMAEQVMDTYNKCVAELFPDGIGKCTENEQLYFSKGNRSDLYDCVYDNVGELDKRNDNENQEWLEFCVETTYINCITGDFD
ncbi:hypothetical protein TNCT_331841 [Trichonephila clavata]|uniref:Uncharacterized protein n=1 Tax=Trichonephila clavata TaxID=2740835 RepID=A0A8X6JED2_TRICU|nr:hypothetical protein TNCT_331841 [Trichonephila clavata]